MASQRIVDCADCGSDRDQWIYWGAIGLVRENLSLEQQDELVTLLDERWKSLAADAQAERIAIVKVLDKNVRPIEDNLQGFEELWEDREDPAKWWNQDINDDQVDAFSKLMVNLAAIKGWFSSSLESIRLLNALECPDRERCAPSFKGFEILYWWLDGQHKKVLAFHEMLAPLYQAVQARNPPPFQGSSTPGKRGLYVTRKYALKQWVVDRRNEARRVRNEEVLTSTAGPLASEQGNPFDQLGWKFMAQLGQGGQGRACLWGRYDENGNLRERICRKDEFIDPREYHTTTRFRGDVRAGNFKPMEWLLQKKCNDQPEGKNFVELRHCEVDFEALTLRLYSAFCQHKDLDAVLRGLAVWCRVNPKPLPEAFLWSALESLTECGLVMQRGYVSDQSTQGQNWDEIVHVDLKPLNVFLDVPSNRYSAYPTLRMGDFGSAIETYLEDPANPAAYVGQGTTDYRATEQLVFVDMNTGKDVDDFKILSPCNVWQIGMTILVLMNPEDWRDNELRQLSYEPGTKLQHSNSSQARNTYSKTLCDLLDNMVRWNPAERPTFDAILDSINAYVQEDRTAVQKYVRLARTADPKHKEAEWSSMEMSSIAWDWIRAKEAWALTSSGVDSEAEPTREREPEPAAASGASPGRSASGLTGLTGLAGLTALGRLVLTGE